ncbi:S-methyl-5-thioribose-1-phosphate isomerase, partial [Enterobacter sp. DRP3]|nr:S-methyl-5-thioribose-1-phosphate isomerase [Enterobacter sp. DRP3]
ERDGREVTHMTGRLPDGGFATIEVVSPGSPVANPAFDVTPARLVTGIITERGICAASEEGLYGLYPERRKAA